MASSVDIKLVVKHLVNGTLDSHFCRICLLPLGAYSVNIYNTICSEIKEFNIAEVLEELCQIQFTNKDSGNICSTCVNAALNAYKFHMLAKRSDAILNFYVKEIEQNVSSIEIPEEKTYNSICIRTRHFDHDADGLMVDNSDAAAQKLNVNVESEDDADILVINENGMPTIYCKNESDKYIPLSRQHAKLKGILKTKKIRKKRERMVYTKCSKCPVKYRFLTKLKEHMKHFHKIELLICMICKETFEDQAKFKEHIDSHPEQIYRCDKCNRMFKRLDTFVAHKNLHESITDLIHICEVCGVLLTTENELNEHYDKKHYKKYNCFYCGRMYRTKISLDLHIEKHEMHAVKQKDKPPVKSNKGMEDENASSLTCSTCERSFVDERSLMWHTMLHTNERPFKCDTCGRGFVSMNRRNQHALCAHSAPTRRCPLCPALFHLKSMVNTHVKKVHLRSDKRRNRASKYQNVSWKTEPVPFQELSVSVQNEILELQTRNNQSNDVILVE